MQWRVDVNGPTWHVFLDEETQKGRTLFNGKALVATPPGTDQQWFDSARAFLDMAHGVMGVDGGTNLIDGRVLMLPLGMTGGTDKMSVRLRQAVQGVPVRGGLVNALFDLSGNLVCLDSDGLPGISGFDVQPTIDATVATSVATAAFVAETGEQPSYVAAPVLVVAQRLQGTSRSGVLAWEIEVDGDDQAILYRIQAKDSATLVQAEPLTHNCYQQGSTTSGTVAGSVTSGPAPAGSGVPDWSYDRAENLVADALPHLFVRKRSNNALLGTTKADGTFRFVAGGNPINVILRFQGPFVDVCSLSGESLTSPPCNDPLLRVDYVRDDLFVTPNAPNNLFFSPAVRDPLTVAQANVFLRVNQTREWIKNINPLDKTFDDGAPYLVRPNRISPFTSGCPAAFTRRDGQRIIWFSKVWHDLQHDCTYNSAFPTVVWHEMGHWLNELYDRGNDKKSGFGEGVADVWALYQADFPRLGIDDNPNFPTQPARFGDQRNSFCFCGDCPPAGVDHARSECLDFFSSTDDHRDDITGASIGCTAGTQGCHHGKEHGNGMPLMGALWRMRENLKSSHGASLGGAVSNALFLGWMGGFSTPRIKSIIAYQFAILDGDGVLSQAPNFAAIDAAFVAKSFPAIQLPPLRLICF